MNGTRQVDVTETARLLRKRLKREFPGTKFSIQSKRYAGGASIRVHWQDGPLGPEVKAVTGQYEGAGFDAMIDMKYQREHWLRRDGTVVLRHCPGTAGSMGMVPETDNRDLDDTMPDDAERVRFGADYIHTYREISNLTRRTREAEDWVYNHCHITQAGEERNPGRDKFGQQRVTDLAYRIVESQKEDEDLQTAYRRAVGLS